jgi:hypothetical protein
MRRSGRHVKRVVAGLIGAAFVINSMATSQAAHTGSGHSETAQNVALPRYTP